MKYRYFVYCLLLLPILGRGQGFVTVFETAHKEYGIKTIEIPNENAYLVFSQVSDYQIWDVGLSISKVDHTGNVVWQKIDTSVTNVISVEIKESMDGFYVAVGQNFGDTLSNIKLNKYNFEGELVEHSDYMPSPLFRPSNLLFLTSGELICLSKELDDEVYSLIKLSSNGNLIWEKENSDTSYLQFTAKGLQMTSDGDMVAVSEDYYKTNPPHVIKFDSEGNLVWREALPWNFLVAPSILSSKNTEEYFVRGLDQSNFLDSYIGKMNSDGELVWYHKLIADHFAISYDFGVIESEAGGWCITTEIHDTGGNKTSFIKLDGDGNTLLSKYYDSDNFNQSGQLLVDSEGSFFIVASSFNTTTQHSGPYIIKIDSIGNMLWNWYYEIEEVNGSVVSSITSDGSCLFLGNITNETDVFFKNLLIKIGPDGMIYSDVNPPISASELIVEVYPQPAGEAVIFELKSTTGQQPYRLEILNLLGQKLYDQPIREGTNTVSHLPAGQLFYCLRQDGAVVETGKVVIVK